MILAGIKCHESFPAATLASVADNAFMKSIAFLLIINGIIRPLSLCFL